MAIATATCVCKTCGREFKKELYGFNRKNADSKVTWTEGYFDECPDCYAKRKQRERDEANAVAAKEAEAAGLPELTGTEKQVVWATTLRQKVISAVTAEIENARVKGANDADVAQRLFDIIISRKTGAYWWIDHRDAPWDYGNGKWTIYILSKICPAELAEAKEAPEETEIRKAAEAEMTVAPENRMHGGIAEITVTDTLVSVKYEKNDDFRTVVKGLGYSWNGDNYRWEKRIYDTTGTAQERAAELGSNLLNAGFAVQIADPDVRSAAISGDYQPEHRRWVWTAKGDKYKGKFIISWVREDDLYKQAKAIRGAAYDSPDMVVPGKSWQEVLDFADMYDFRITPAAQKLIDEQKTAIIVVAPAPVKAAAYQEHNPEDTLNSGADVLADLVDD